MNSSKRYGGKLMVKEYHLAGVKEPLRIYGYEEWFKEQEEAFRRYENCPIRKKQQMDFWYG